MTEYVLNLCEQRIADQARMIRKHGWLTEEELEEIKRKITKEDTTTEVEQISDADETEEPRQEVDEPTGAIMVTQNLVAEGVTEKQKQLEKEPRYF